MCIFDPFRLLSLDVAQPLLIDEEEEDGTWRMLGEDRFTQWDGPLQHADPQTADVWLVVMLPISRMIAPLKNSLQARVITPTKLKEFEEHFEAISASIPDEYQAKFEGPLEPRSLSIACTFLTVQFLLYRHNLSTACRHADRVGSLNRCVYVALDTARLISRTMRSSSPPTGRSQSPQDYWQDQIVATTHNMLCMHLWRCLLILCFRAYFEEALTCLRVSAAIGDIRPANVACGRHLAFFLEQLAERNRHGKGSPQQLESDEEMLAYLSGDLQASPSSAWVWLDSKHSMENNAISADRLNDVEMSIAAHTNSVPEMNHVEAQNGVWSGWDSVERMIVRLRDEQRRSQNLAASQQRAQVPQEPGLNARPASASSMASSRISIANII